MKSRFRLSAMAGLLTATTGMVFGPTFTLMAQAPRRESTSVIKRNYQQTLGSAVQRELEKLYAKDGKRVPKFTTEDALQNIRQSRNLVHQTKTAQPAAAKRSSPLNKNWFERILSTGKSRSRFKQKTIKQASIKPAGSRQAAVKQAAESKPASKLRGNVSQITQSEHRISQSASSPKSITIVNKAAPNAPAQRKTVEPKTNAESKSTGVKQPRLLESIAQKGAQLINRPNSKQNGQTRKSIQKESQRPVRSTSTPSNSRHTTYSNSRARRRGQSRQSAPRPRPAAVPTPQSESNHRLAKAKPLNRQPAARSEASRAETTGTPSANPQSDILRELEQIYRRDGREMPSMKLAEQPMSQGSLEQALKSRNLQKKSQSDARQTASSSNIFKRIWQLRPKLHRSPTKGQQRIVQKPAPQSTGTSVKKLAASSIDSRQVKKPQPSPSQAARVVVKPRIAEIKAPAKPNKANGQPVKLDQKQMPFSGLKLADKKPKSSKTRLIPNHKQSVLAKSATPKPQATKLAEKKVVQKPKNNAPAIKPSIVPKTRVASTLRSIRAKQNRTKADERSQDAHKRKHADKYSLIAQRGGLKGLKGFCPVALRDRRELLDGKSEFHSHYKSMSYNFSSAQAKASFDKNPMAYSPVAGGNDVVLLARTRVEIEGALDHAVWYRGRLYLFSSDETLKVFVSNPHEYVLFE